MKNLFKNKKVLIMGLGLHGGGVGVAKFFCKMGADVLVTDLKTEEKLKDSIEKLKGLKIKYVLGKHEEADFISSDLIIKNPDVPATSPYLEIARKNDVSIETDVSLFFKLAEAFTIGVTGTKGKSTTASLIYHILKQEYNRVFLAGNIGISPLEILPLIKKGDKVVFEQVLLSDNGTDTKLGMPFINGSTVEGIYQEDGRAKKVIVVKYKAKSKYHKKNGHRQPYSEVKISAIK